MDAIIKAIGKTPSLATLPLRVEEGYLPALLTQSGGAMRALGAAILRRETDRPIFVLCTDETNAGTLAADLEAMLGESVVRVMDPNDFLTVLDSGRPIHDKRCYLAEYDRYVDETVIYDRDYHLLICIMRDVTSEEDERKKKETIREQTVDIADKVVDKQMRIVQEIASLLGETAAETKIALTKLKESISDE